MALDQLMQQAARLSAEGMDPPTIATKLGVSIFWTKMVMGTDAFTLLVRRIQDENATAQGNGNEAPRREEL